MSKQKQILIRHPASMSDVEAIKRVYTLFVHDPDRRGIATFADGSCLTYSETSKYPTITITTPDEN